MRLSRNLNWGDPNLIKSCKRFASKVPAVKLERLSVGDMASCAATRC